jgi:hypothetical protein
MRFDVPDATTNIIFKTTQMTNPKDTTGKPFYQGFSEWEKEGTKYSFFEFMDKKAKGELESQGKRWWEELLKNEFKGEYMKWDKLKAFIAKVEDEAYRKGITDSIGALPKEKENEDFEENAKRDQKRGFNRAISEAKENMERLIK